MLDVSTTAAFHVPLLEDRQAPARVLTNRFDQREVGSAGRPTAKLDAVFVFPPAGHIRDEIDTEGPSGGKHTANGIERRGEIAVAEQ